MSASEFINTSALNASQHAESPSLLIVEDDDDFRETLKLEFSDRGYLVKDADSFQAVSESLTHKPYRFAIVDLRLRGDSGLDVIAQVLEHCPNCRIVVLTGYGSIPTAVEAVKRGAVNYLTKPVPIERLEKALWVDLPDEPQPESDEPIESLDRHEQDYIEYVLLQCGGNISQAARWLGLHRQSLQRKLKRIGLK